MAVSVWPVLMAEISDFYMLTLGSCSNREEELHPIPNINMLIKAKISF